MVADRTTVPFVGNTAGIRQLPTRNKHSTSVSSTTTSNARQVRLSHSVDRDLSYSPTTMSVSALSARRYSVSTVGPTACFHGTGNMHVQQLPYTDDSLQFKSLATSPFRWSRKGIIYTADSMRSVIGHIGAMSSNNHISTYRSSSVPRHSITIGTDDVRWSSRSTGVSSSRHRAASLSRLDNTAHGAESRQYYRRASSLVPHDGSLIQRRGAVIYKTSPSSGLHATSAARPIGKVPLGILRHTCDDDGLDLAAFVLSPGEHFVPTDVSMTILPSGQKAVTYTQFLQKGHGDQSQANDQIDRIVKRTKLLQDSMHTLENFVRNNRSLFPEDIIIYQHIVFYLLSEEELKKLGETRTDAEVYGVKIRERLVAPYGTDVASVLKRYYSRHTDVDIEYKETEDIRSQLRKEMGEDGLEDRTTEIRGARRRKYIGADTDVTSPEVASPDYEFYVKRHRSASNDKRSLDHFYNFDEVQAHRTCQQMPPQITARLQHKCVHNGDSVRFSCSVEGNPEPTVSWYHDGHALAADGRHHINNTFGLCILKVTDVCNNYAGMYTAKAANNLGEVSTTAELCVLDDADELSQSTANSTQAPLFIVDARNVFAEVGQRAVFEVQAVGWPLPTFTWKKDNIDVVLENRIRTMSDQQGNAKLVIRDLKTTDAGVYVCLAENSEGKSKCAASLRVARDESDLVQPSSHVPLLAMYGSDVSSSPGHLPQFVQTPPLHITVNEGDPLTLRCIVDSHPPAVVTWYKGVRELTYSERHRVLSEGNNQYMMQIKSTLQTDPGEYTAVATNSCGHAKFTVFVNVFSISTSRDEDSQWNTPKLSEQQFELVRKLEKGKMPPIFIVKLPREKIICTGQTLLFKCHIEETKMREYLVNVGLLAKGVSG